MSKKSRNPVALGKKIEKAIASDQPQAAGTELLRGDAADGLVVGGDLDMRIARDGTWFYRGTPIRRKPLVKLFASVLRRDEAGEYWLQTPVERGRIEVEDAPFTAVELRTDGSGQEQVLRFRTNLDEWVEAGSGHPIDVAEDAESGEPRPYILVREGLKALILRSVFYELADLAVAQSGRDLAGVWSHGEFFVLGSCG